jgi:hypothetical protein
VVRREAWLGVQYDERYTGSAYSHAFILLSLVAGGCTLHYDSRQLVYTRLGNDSFLDGGLARRMRIDFDGYGAIRDQVFANDPLTREQINRMLTEVHPWYALARFRPLLTAAEWEQILKELQAVDCSAGKLYFVRLMSHWQLFLRGYIWIKVCVSRRKIKRW